MPVKEPLTQDSLMRAYRLLKKPDWVGGLDDALRDPIRGRFIRGIARRMQSGQWGKPVLEPAKKTISTPTSIYYRSRNIPSGLDFKSLAAGEREDD